MNEQTKLEQRDDGRWYLPGTDVAVLKDLEPLLRPIDSVHPDPANPRTTQNLDALVGSIKRFGVRKPVVANARDGILEAGHQTQAALKALGATHLPVVFADDNRIDATAYNIADNRTAEVVAAWDDKALSALLNDLRAEADGLEGVGFSTDEIDALRLQMAEAELPSMDGFEREADGLSEPATEEFGKPAKPDGSYFYVEFYGEDELFAELTAALGPMLTTKHQLDPHDFAAMVRAHAEGQTAPVMVREAPKKAAVAPKPEPTLENVFPDTDAEAGA